MKILINLFVNTIAVIIAAYLLPGVHVSSFIAAFFVSLVFSIFNTFLKPILLILTFPLTLMTLGLFTLIINGILVALISWVVPGFQVNNFLWAILFSLILSIISGILRIVVK